jgi:hypothetical protein
VRVPVTLVSYGRMCGLVSAVHVSSPTWPKWRVGPAVGLGQSIVTAGGAASALSAGGAAGAGGLGDATVHAMGAIAMQAERRITVFIERPPSRFLRKGPINRAGR